MTGTTEEIKKQLIEQKIQKTEKLGIEKTFDRYCQLFFKPYHENLEEWVEANILGKRMNQFPFQRKLNLYTQIRNRHELAEEIYKLIVSDGCNSLYDNKDKWKNAAKYARKQYREMQKFL